MKKITFVLLSAFFALSLNLNAQTAIDKIFEKYSGTAGFTSVTINKNMFDMISRMDTSEDGKEFSDAVSKLESIRILAMDSVNNGGVNLYEVVMNALPTKDYKELMDVKDNGNNVKFMVREKGDIITELLLISDGNNEENALVVIKGEIDLASIGAIGKSMNFDGLAPLQKLKKRK
ncbi:MAG: DUF4252 domain-containing protein [Bacteroidales bacterium]|nr:DUF4252 domain-containing protein [Bacteroidales bacterium]